MQIPHKSVVLVADGRKMLFLRNEGDAEHPNLVVEQKEKQDNPSNTEQTTHAAGQKASPRGTPTSSVEPTDFHQIEEDRFAADAAEMLKMRAFDNDYESLIIVAPPRTLGELRKHYHKEVSDRLSGEIDKDLTGHPINEIEALIQKA
jgi:protein required for attachment to host cells